MKLPEKCSDSPVISDRLIWGNYALWREDTRSLTAADEGTGNCRPCGTCSASGTRQTGGSTNGTEIGAEPDESGPGNYRAHR